MTFVRASCKHDDGTAMIALQHTVSMQPQKLNVKGFIVLHNAIQSYQQSPRGMFKNHL